MDDTFEEIENPNIDRKAIAFFEKRDPKYIEGYEEFDADRHYAISQRYQKIVHCGAIVRQVKPNGKLLTFRYYCHDKTCSYCTKQKIKKEISSICKRAEEAGVEELYEITVDTNNVKYDTVRKQISRAGGEIVKRIPQQNGEFIIYATEKPREKTIVSAGMKVKNISPLEITPESVKELLDNAPQKSRITGPRKRNENETKKVQQPEQESIVVPLPSIIFDNENKINSDDIITAWLKTEKLVTINPETMTLGTYKEFILKRAKEFCRICNEFGYSSHIAFYEPVSITLQRAREEIKKANEMTESETINDIKIQEQKVKLEDHS